jgi:ATP phosphoribosyltransferase
VTLTATTTNVTNDVNANIVDWNSTGATLTKDGVTSYPQVAIASGTVDANVVDWNSLGATLSVNATTNLPDVSISGTVDANVVDWNSTGATLTANATTNFPDVSIADTSVDAIAGAVWDSPLSSHLTTDTFGYLMQIIAGLTHYNHRIKDTTYDQSGRLTACRIVVYTNAADADADINELAKIVVTSTYNASNNMLSYVAKKE